ncbi:hypothetical protein ACFQY7_08610 [Actinomadura luteofluorescens]|uniref:hypothetical protein n=1 Tax=Actinomadura luteofluorescens TaxID=46163 RepID=UPI003624CEE3
MSSLSATPQYDADLGSPPFHEKRYLPPPSGMAEPLHSFCRPRTQTPLPSAVNWK